jgi:hypothetical protein
VPVLTTDASVIQTAIDAQSAENELLRKVLRQTIGCHDWSIREEGCDTKVYEAAWAAARAALGD